MLTNKNPRVKNIVAYFDFDGTITTHDTLIPFLLYTVGYIKFLRKLYILLPLVLLYWLKIITNEVAKQGAIITLLKGYDLDYIEDRAYLFAKLKLDKYIKPNIYSKLEYHREHHHAIIIVSANLAIYLNFWIQLHNLHGVIATEIEFVNNTCSGYLQTKNCYDREKITRIEQYLKQTQQKFEYSYAYGNSSGDYAMLIYADESYWVNGNDIIPWNEYRDNRSLI